MSTLQIVGALVCLGLGVWLGMPGRYERSERDIERAMDRPDPHRHRAKRQYTFIDWLARKPRGTEKRMTGGGGRFRTTTPNRKSEARGGSGAVSTRTSPAGSGREDGPDSGPDPRSATGGDAPG